MFVSIRTKEHTTVNGKIVIIRNSLKDEELFGAKTTGSWAILKMASGL